MQKYPLKFGSYICIVCLCSTARRHRRRCNASFFFFSPISWGTFGHLHPRATNKKSHRVTRTGFAMSSQESTPRTHFQMLVEDESGRELLFDVPQVRQTTYYCCKPRSAFFISACADVLTDGVHGGGAHASRLLFVARLYYLTERYRIYEHVR